jgi:septum formation protein
VILLASASPRRHELLEALGFRFAVMPAEADESSRPGEAPAELAVRLAATKAMAVAGTQHDALVVAADTLVVLHGDILGKPADVDDAAGMLGRLRAREHLVMTGLALVDPAAGRMLMQLATTGVAMRSYSQAEIDAYVTTGDPLDKAGAYAIQHAVFAPVARLEDCYANVVGLPLCHLVRGLRLLGIEAPRHPLEACPYAVEHGGCPWSEPILDEPAARWARHHPADPADGAS